MATLPKLPAIPHGFRSIPPLRLPEPARTAARVAWQVNNAAAQAVLVTSLQRAAGNPHARSGPLPAAGLVEFLARAMPARDATAAELRAALEAVTRLSPLPLPRCEPATLGGVPCLLVAAPEPTADAARVVLYLHGGGYCAGSPRTHLGLLGQVAEGSDARVVAPDYRLAPEAPFPAALEDAWAVYWALLAQGTRPERMVIMGDSAGGGLTVALLLALREAGMPLPAAGVCLSPWLDLTEGGVSRRTNAAFDYLNAAIIRCAVRMYLGEADPRTPLASPLYADLRGLPPLLIQVGTAEMLLDDATRFARRAVAAGVPVELELWENMVHVWHLLLPIEPQAEAALRRAACFVRAHTGLADANEAAGAHGPAH